MDRLLVTFVQVNTRANHYKLELLVIIVETSASYRIFSSEFGKQAVVIYHEQSTLAAM